MGEIQSGTTGAELSARVPAAGKAEVPSAAGGSARQPSHRAVSGGRRRGGGAGQPVERAARWLSTLLAAVWARRAGFGLLTAVLVVCGLVHGVNLDGWPGRLNDDEGTYAAQAYAMQYQGRLTHYAYWYDHPFGGWAQIAAYTTVTGAFDRAPTGVDAAREFMLWAHLVSCALLYLLARRLGLRRFFASAAVLLFSLSPLAVWFQRMVFLDNIEMVWVLAALACAASPRGRTGSAALVGVLLGLAFWSKESALLFLPGVWLLLWMSRTGRDRAKASAVFLAVFTAVAGSWVLFALARGELHQLEWATRYQLFDRPTSGSALDAGTAARVLVEFWFGIDPYLLTAGLVAALSALLVRRLRAVAVLLLLQAANPLRDGYLPYSFVIGVLPFAALCVAGLLDEITPGRRELVASPPDPAAAPAAARNAGQPAELLPAGLLPAAHRAAGWAARHSGPAVARVRFAAVGLVVAAGLVVLPWQWRPQLHTALTADDGWSSREATSWFLANVPPGQVAITNDNVWLDLVRAGADPPPIWHWKTTDPEVAPLLPRGWRDVDYVILDTWMEEQGARQAVPLMDEALTHSVLVRSFGEGAQEVSIYRVVDD